MVISTPNRTRRSTLLLVGAAERLGAVPQAARITGTISSRRKNCANCSPMPGLTMGEPRGIAFSPCKGLELSSDLSLNYIVTARRG